MSDRIFQKVIIFIDGGSRGNPGPAAFGVVVAKGGKVLKKYSQYIGGATNNEAEYQGLIFALKKAKALFGKEKIKKISIEIKSDSELLIKQMKGEYKIKNPKIQPLFLKAWNLKIDFKNLKFSLISRQKNREADRLVNEVLDANSRTQKLF
ncbi:ribonuclease HI family protein [Patescibacteria group bacterium]|nr:ribonuclease HI family protein [Patescibacteria group bacterium]